MAAQIDDLINQLAALEVADATRHSKRLQFPGAEMVIEFEKIACEMMGWTRSGSKPTLLTLTFFTMSNLLSFPIFYFMRGCVTTCLSTH
jgi:hypothetical protein